MEPIKICAICLRTNRKLKNVTAVLSAYHNKITNDSLQVTGNLYCSECECLLRKIYNFHLKCLNAAIIFKTWLKDTQGRKRTPASTLHTKLPQSNLELWTHQSSKVYHYKYVSPENVDPPDDIDMDDDTPREEVVESTNHSEDIIKNIKTEMHSEDNHITKESESPLKKIKIESDDNTRNKLSISTAGKGETANLKINRTKRDSKRRQQNLSKSMLKSELMAKFNSFGKLRADDGTVFDKDVIINCLDMVSDRAIRQLIKLLHGAKTLSPRAAVILDRIQNKQNKKLYESIFDIEFLNTEKEMLEEFQRRKTYECYVKAEFKCQVCYQGFKSERLLNYHKKCHDASSGPLCCTICHMRYPSRRHLNKHLRASHEAVYKCKLCPLVTYYRNSMINHYEQHNGILYKCEPCQAAFKSRSALLSHLTQRHPHSEHVCSTCGRGFASAQGLSKHISGKHPGGLPAPSGNEVTCEMCNKAFVSEQALHKHQANVHRDKAERASRGRPRGRGPRVVRKPPVTTMTCILCNKVGANYQWLVRHFALEHPGQDIHTAYLATYVHLCHICGKGLKSAHMLHSHMSQRHAADGYKCPECGKNCPSRVALRNHQLVHGPRTYCCKQCGKKFRTPSNLYNHTRCHTNDRRFECDICGKRFLFRAAIDEHIRGVHHKLPRVRKGTGATGGTKRSRSIEPDADYSENPNKKDVPSKKEKKEDKTEMEEEMYTDLEVLEDLEDEMELELGAEINV